VLSIRLDIYSRFLGGSAAPCEALAPKFRQYRVRDLQHISSELKNQLGHRSAIGVGRWVVWTILPAEKKFHIQSWYCVDSYPRVCPLTINNTLLLGVSCGTRATRPAQPPPVMSTSETWHNFWLWCHVWNWNQEIKNST
jgi:hypothetical protein